MKTVLSEVYGLFRITGPLWKDKLLNLIVHHCEKPIKFLSPSLYIFSDIFQRYLIIRAHKTKTMCMTAYEKRFLYFG